MKLSYFALLRNVTRKTDEEWTRPAATVGDLLHDLIATYGPEFRRWVMPDGANLGLAIILLDGRDVRSLQGLQTALDSRSNVLIFPPLAGG